jgi:hypothetical protein
MIIVKRVSTVITLLGFFLALGSLGNEVLAQTNKRGHHRLPPEAYTACEGKSVGDTAELETPHGDLLTGICVEDEDEDRLVLRPENPPETDQRKHHGPPPEAYSACEGKDAGDIAELETPEGDLMTGTCVEDEDGEQLVLRPDDPPHGEGRSRDGS